MTILRRILGVLLIIGGLVAGVLLDFKIFVFGGIIEFINGVKATPTNGHDVTWGLLKLFVFGGTCTVLTLIFLVLPGLVLVGLKKKRKDRRQR